MPIIEEEIDGLSGLLFPFYDADTHMLYLAGKVHIHIRILTCLSCKTFKSLGSVRFFFNNIRNVS